MVKLKINKKDYKIKFGYRALAKSGILGEVMEISNTLSENQDTVKLVENMLDTLANLVLAGLQRNHDEYKVDYDDADAVKNKLEDVYDLLDDYMDDESNSGIMGLFQTLTAELMNNGFFSQQGTEQQKAMAQMDATIVPLDHQKANA